MIGIIGGAFAFREYLHRIRFIRVRITRRDDALFKNMARCLVIRIDKIKALRNADFDDKATQNELLSALEKFPNWESVPPNGGVFWSLNRPGRYLLISRLYVKNLVGDVGQIITIMSPFDAERGYEYPFELRETHDRFTVEPMARHKIE